MIINFSNIGGGSGSGSGLSPDNYYTKSQIDSQGYVTSADSVNFATSADLKTVTDHIEESEEVISTAINDLNSRIASGGSGGASYIQYVDNLNFSGDTSNLYMYKGNLYRWTTSAGTLATFVGLNPDTANQDPKVGVVHYDYIPQSFDGALMFRYYYTYAESDAMYVYYDFTNDRLLSFHGEQSNPLTATPDFTFYKGTKYEITQWNNGVRKLSFYWTDGVVTFKQEADSNWYMNIANLNKLTVNGPHFELVDRNIRVYSSNWQFSGTTSDVNEGVPKWNSQGIITGKKGNINTKQIYVNSTGGTSYLVLWSQFNGWNSTSAFFPTNGGASGNILKSNGNAEPTWVTLASLMGGLTIVNCSEADYESMSSHDGKTLYIIDPEE